MSSVASAVFFASSFTSPATTANPLPASPARAASIVAFKASSLVCSAISTMTSVTREISMDAAESSSTRPEASFEIASASDAVLRDPSAERAISRIDADISSAEAATVRMFELTESAELETSPERDETSLDASRRLLPVMRSSREDAATSTERPRIFSRLSRMAFDISKKLFPNPSLSERGFTAPVRSPLPMRAASSAIPRR